MNMRVTTVAADAAGTTVALESLATEGLNKGCSIRVTAMTDVKVRAGETVEPGEIVGTRNVGSDRRVNCGMTFPQQMLFQGNPEWSLAGPAAAASPSALPTLAPSPPTALAFPTPEPIQFTPGASEPVLEGAARRTSRYGERLDPFTGERAFHDGIDLAQAYGSSVRSPASAVVTFAGIRGEDGMLVELAFADGLRLRFAHLGRIDVALGERVEPAQVIGLIGSTGRNAGAHLHLEAVKDGNIVDPETIEGLVLSGG
jgi:hypothetical protein